MIRKGKMSFNAAHCAGRSGTYAFGLIDARVASALRKLAEDIETGEVVLHSITTSCHATHEEFTIREVTIEVLEDYPGVWTANRE
jgi:hypothetical protein